MIGELGMTTRVRLKPKALHDQDFYVWTEVQADLLRERQFEALDLPNLIEEVEGLEDAKKSAVLSNASVIIEHLPKLQHRPSQEPRRGWADTILEHRDRLELELTPRLRQILEDELRRFMPLRAGAPNADFACMTRTPPPTRFPPPAPTARSDHRRLVAVNAIQALPPKPPDSLPRGNLPASAGICGA
jgi:Domain of unknown function DUF29